MATDPSLELTCCPLCAADHSRSELRVVDWLHGSGAAFDLVRCLECGLVYVNPRPSRAAIGGFYPRATYYAYRRDARDAAFGHVRREHRALARFVSARSPAGSDCRALDVGCGDGSFMLALRAEGWEVQGVEADVETARHLRDRVSLDVVDGPFAAGSLPRTHYDLVSMLEVLEHMHAPLDALSDVRSLLKPGGWLVVSVPNVASLEYRVWRADWVALEPPIHLVHFSPRTLRQALRQTGFADVSIRTTASTSGLTRSAWLKVRRRSRSPHVTPAPYRRRSWRRAAHGVASGILAPVGWLLASVGRGPGLIAYARRPALDATGTGTGSATSDRPPGTRDASGANL